MNEQQAAGVLGDVRCFDIHHERWEDGAVGVTCPACKSWADFYITPILAAAQMAPSRTETKRDYVLDGSPEAVAIVREARGLPPVTSPEVAP